MRLLLGIDAGGSHTEAVAADEPQHVLARWQGEPGAVRQGRESEAVARWTEAVHGVLELSGRPEQISSVVVGAAGAGREETRRHAERLLSDALGGDVLVHVTTDGAITLEAAFPNEPGCVVTAGSGCIAYARDSDGRLWRAGGLGWQIGDEGSGFGLAHAALRAVGRAMDGRGETTALCDLLLNAVGVTALPELVHWSLSASTREIAALARDVAACADEGDAVAIQLIDEAAADLVGHVAALVKVLGTVQPTRVALTGGLLRPGSAVRRSLVAQLQETHPTLEIVQQLVDPAIGALRLAHRLATGGRPPTTSHR